MLLIVIGTLVLYKYMRICYRGAGCHLNVNAGIWTLTLLEDISSGQALPNHVKDACKYCAYRSICRNSANEVEPKLRVEKEEE